MEMPGTARRLAVNGVTLAVWEAGDGFPVVLCHGFPELAYSWRYQLPALAGAGYRAIAPDQRGYGASTRPADVAAYDIDRLTGDLVALLDALGIERAVFAGHDWGGIVVWHLPQLHPQRVAGVIALNTPFQPRRSLDLVTMLRNTVGPDHYIVRFQEPDVPDAILARDPARALERMYRRPLRRGAPPAPEELRRSNTLEALAGGGPASGEPFLPPEDLAVYVDAFRRTGFTGALNWYRNFRRNWERMEGVRQEIDVPALMISAADDPFLPPRLTEGMERWVPRLERHVVPDCGHWTQQEQPEAVNRLMVDWLRRRFRPVRSLRLLPGGAG